MAKKSHHAVTSPVSAVAAYGRRLRTWWIDAIALVCPDRLMSSSRQRNFAPTSRSSSPKNTNISSFQPLVIHRRPSFLTAAHPLLQLDVELELVCHFSISTFPLSFFLPVMDEAYLLRCKLQLMEMMLQSNSVKNAVLASCASNKHTSLGNNWYRLVAL